MHVQGLGVEKNYETAAMWYHHAASQGDKHALSNLSSLYGQGLGVEENVVLAYVYASLAADLGDDSGAENRDFAASLLNSDQIAEGDRLVEEWQVDTPLPTETETWP